MSKCCDLCLEVRTIHKCVQCSYAMCLNCLVRVRSEAPSPSCPQCRHSLEVLDGEHPVKLGCCPSCSGRTRSSVVDPLNNLIVDVLDNRLVGFEVPDDESELDDFSTEVEHSGLHISEVIGNPLLTRDLKPDVTYDVIASISDDGESVVYTVSSSDYQVHQLLKDGKRVGATSKFEIREQREICWKYSTLSWFRDQTHPTYAMQSHLQCDYCSHRLSISEGGEGRAHAVKMLNHIDQRHEVQITLDFDD